MAEPYGSGGSSGPAEATAPEGPFPASPQPGVKVGARRSDHRHVNLTQCPYDSTEIATEYSGGSFLLSCSHCGAEWELHSNFVRRVAEPDWSVVDDSRRDAQLGATV